MKTKFNPVRLSFVTAALGVLALAACAGSSPEFENRTRPMATVVDPAAVRSDNALAMVCVACKTATIRSSKSVGLPNQNHQEWFTIGSKHKCDHCGGEISVVKGKTTDSMQHNCSMCGEGAAFCCAVPVAVDKK